MEIEQWPIDRPKPYDKNPRNITDAAIDKVVSSIKSFGWRQPIVVDAAGVIIVGHTRWRAAKKMGQKTVPVHIASDLSENKIRAYRLADNRTGSEVTWNDDLLIDEMTALYDADFDLVHTAFNPDEIAKMFGIELDDPSKEWDGMPEYDNEDQRSARQIVVHFKNNDDVDEFARRIGQSLTEKTKSIWYPEVQPSQLKDKRYAAGADFESDEDAA